jgi:hypothetical protein
MHIFLRILIIGLVLFGQPHTSSGQSRIVAGYVSDATTGEKLVGASIYDAHSKQGVVSNNYGFFSLTVSSSTFDIVVSYVGYQTQHQTRISPNNSLLLVSLKPTQLDEVTITGASEIQKIGGVMNIPIKQLKDVPALLGEIDVIKSLALLPGVHSGLEGSAGLYVRGGSPDQNLFLLDETPLYNVVHLGGFFSVFNAEAVKNIDFYKGGFPARFGGRLASVIDITTKDGNNQRFAGRGSIGLVNQNVSIEGPLIKNKASFVFSGRLSNLGITRLLKARPETTPAGYVTSYFLYDWNAKLNFQLSPKDQLFISAYSGYDFFESNRWSLNLGNGSLQKNTLDWGNTSATLRYSRIYSEKLFGRIILLSTNYQNNFKDDYTVKRNNIDDLTTVIVKSYIQDIGLKARFEYFPNNKFSLYSGADLIWHKYRPTSFQVNKELSTQVNNNLEELSQKISATELGIYAEANVDLPVLGKLNTGLRNSTFNVSGTNYYALEPRIGLNTNLGKNWTAKSNYSRMTQFVHLLSNNGVGLPNDLWVPATDKVPPQTSIQYSFGIFKELPQYGISFSLEAYHKSMKQLIDYPEGTSFLNNVESSWQDAVSKNGIGQVQGLELFVNKTKGLFKGWLSYTLSNSRRQFNDINQGNWYASKYDKRHVISITGSYDLSPKWSFSSTWTYQTGATVTLPEAAFFESTTVKTTRLVYTERNAGRLPDYHRLDIGFTKTKTTNRGLKSQWRFGAYNMYNRANPYYVDVSFASGIAPKTLVLKQYSLFPILPYVNYSISF